VRTACYMSPTRAMIRWGTARRRRAWRSWSAWGCSWPVSVPFGHAVCGCLNSCAPTGRCTVGLLRRSRSASPEAEPRATARTAAKLCLDLKQCEVPAWSSQPPLGFVASGGAHHGSTSPCRDTRHRICSVAFQCSFTTVLPQCSMPPLTGCWSVSSWSPEGHESAGAGPRPVGTTGGRCRYGSGMGRARCCWPTTRN